MKKSANTSQTCFESHLGQNLLRLQRELQEGNYRPSPMKCFIVDEPKPREIFAADFRDRVVHHLIIAVMEPIWERKFIHPSFACRKGKGVHGALTYLRTLVRSMSRGGRSAVWVLQMDLARFFVSIHRPTLCDLMERYAPTPEVRSLIRTIYRHDGRIGAKMIDGKRGRSLIPPSKSWFSQPADFGLPIGNLTSQFGANVYLNGLDHYIQRCLKPKGYLRYMDDLLLIDRDIDRLKGLEILIDGWLREHRHQSLNPAKTKLVRLENGITYLGYEIAQVGDRSEPVKLFPTGKKKWKFVRGLRRLTPSNEPVLYRPHRLSLALEKPARRRELASVNSHFGSMIHSQSYDFRKKATMRLEKDSGRSNLSPYQVKKGYRAIRFR